LSGLEGALAAVVSEVRPVVERLFVKLLDESAFVLGAGFPHEVEGGAVEVLPPPRRAVAAARGCDGGRAGGRAEAFRLHPFKVGS
jgi:hypothetical protein